jgi:hypothetical protein
MTLFFSWIKFIDPKLPILIKNSAGQNRQNRKNFENFNFDSSEIKRLAYNSPNFNLKKISLIFAKYTGNIDYSSIIDYYIQTYKINLANYTGVYLVFVQNFPDKKECELLDSKQNPLFPGEWVDSEFVKNGIFKGNNPLVDNLFLPDFDDILVKSTRLEGYDSKLGDKYTATNLSICCISKLTQGIYNDTLCVHGDSIVTYKSTFSLQNTHSGDKKVKYGLEHVISFNSENFTEKAYVISSPWINRKSAEVSTLFDTDPILEIRAKESNVLRRYVIPQDYSESDDHTACINAIVEYVNGKWEVTICRKFIYGFADDLDKIKESIKDLKL